MFAEIDGQDCINEHVVANWKIVMVVWLHDAISSATGAYVGSITWFFAIFCATPLVMGIVVLKA
jgi:hypothetical protein